VGCEDKKIFIFKGILASASPFEPCGEQKGQALSGATERERSSQSSHLQRERLGISNLFFLLV
jgi:hypothetical protein